jgi:hypothetical protein
MKRIHLLALVFALWATSAIGAYAPGFTWQRLSDWRDQPPSSAGKTNGNPALDSLRNPVWSYEWVVGGGGLGSASPWFAQPSRRLVWDTNWYATGIAGWVQADDTANAVPSDAHPFIHKWSMVQNLTFSPPGSPP